MISQHLAQGSRRALIEQGLHLRSFECASSRVFKNRARLIYGDAGKPPEEIMQRRVIFKVLE